MSFFDFAVTTDALRANNRAKILSCVRAVGSCSHTGICEDTGLASGTVSAITAELIDEGVIEKIEQPTVTGRGRPRVLFAPRAEFAHFVLIRISAESMEFSMLNYQSKLIDRKKYARDQNRFVAEAFAQNFMEVFYEFIGRSKLTDADIASVSITSKGEVDSKSNSIIWSPILGSEIINFNHIFGEIWVEKIKVTNELCFVAHNALLDALRAGTADYGDQLAILSLTDSISLGIAKITQYGEIELLSPSLGHMPHISNGPLCRCGANGCLETYAGFYGILRTAYNAPPDQPPARLIPLEQMRTLAQSARKGDRQTSYAFSEAGKALGLSMARIFTIFGPMPLKIVGAGLEFYDLMESSIDAGMADSYITRLGHKIDITFEPNEGSLAFDSNAYETVHQFDRKIVAVRQHMRDL